MDIQRELSNLNELSPLQLHIRFIGEDELYNSVKKIFSNPPESVKLSEFHQLSRVFFHYLFENEKNHKTIKKVITAFTKNASLATKFTHHNAIKFNNPEMLESLLKSGEYCYFYNEDKKTLFDLFFDQKEPNTEILELLIKYKCAFNSQENLSEINKSLIKYFLPEDAPPIISTLLIQLLSKLPVDSAAFFYKNGKSHLKNLVRNLAKKPEILTSHPILVSSLGHILINNTFDKKNFQILDIFIGVLSIDQKYDLMHQAITEGNPEVVRYLLQQGLNPTHPHKDTALSPLFHAAAVKQIHIIEVFTDAGYHLNLLDSQGRTVLDAVISEDNSPSWQNDPEFILDLMNMGARVSEINFLEEPQNIILNKLLNHLDLPTSIPFIRALKKRGADISPYLPQIMSAAIKIGALGFILELLNAFPLYQLSDSDWLALQQLKNIDLVWLITIINKMGERSFNIHHVFSNGKTLFSQSYDKGNKALAAYLILIGASLDDKALKDTKFMHYLTVIQNTPPADQKLRLMLTIKNIAHYLADPFSKNMRADDGSEIEGASKINCISLMTSICASWLGSPEYNLSDQEKTQILSYMSELRESYQLHASIDEALRNPSREAKFLLLNEISKEFEQRLKNAPEGKPIPVSLGWRDTEGGHAIMCTFTRLPMGRVQVRVANTGEGVETLMHDGAQSYINLDESYECTFDELVNESYIYKLFEPSIIGSLINGYSAINLHAVLKMMKKTNGSSIVRRSQLSGTCGFRCHLANAESVLGHDLYKKISLPSKIKTLNYAVDQEQEYLKEDKALRDILGMVCLNIPRRNLKHHPQNSKIELAMEALLGIEKSQNTIAASISKPISTRASIGTPSSLIQQNSISLVKIDPKLNVDTDEDYAVARAAPTNQTVNKPPPCLFHNIKTYADLNDLVNFQITAIKQYYASKDSDDSIFEKIELIATTSTLLNNLSSAFIQTQLQSDHAFRKIAFEVQNDEKITLKLISDIQYLVEAVEDLYPDLESYNDMQRFLAGQSAICSVRILGGFLDDKQQLPHGLGLRLDEYPLKLELSNYIWSKERTFALFNPVLQQHARHLFDYENWLNATNTGKALLQLNDHVKNRGLPNEFLSLEDTGDFAYCSAHLSYLINQNLWNATSAIEQLNGQLKKQKIEKSHNFNMKSWYVHWLYTHEKLPAQYYILRDISMQALCLQPWRGMDDSGNGLEIEWGNIEIVPQKADQRECVSYLPDLGQEILRSYFMQDDKSQAGLLPSTDRQLLDLGIEIDPNEEEELPGFYHLHVTDNHHLFWLKTYPEFRRIQSLTLTNDQENNRGLVLTRLIDCYNENKLDFVEDDHHLFFQYLFQSIGLLKDTSQQSESFTLELNEFFLNELQHVNENLKNKINIGFSKKSIIYLYQNYIFFLNTISSKTILSQGNAEQCLKDIRKEIKALIVNSSTDVAVQLYITLLLSYQNNYPLAFDDAQDLIYSKAFLRNELVDDLGTDRSVLFYRELTNSYFTRLPEIYDHASLDFFKPILSFFGFQTTSSTTCDITQFPNISFKNESGEFSINLKSYHTKEEGKSYQSTPDEILNSDLYEQIFNGKSLNLVKKSRYYEAKGSKRPIHIHYRTEKFLKGSIDPVTEISVQFDKNWYKFIPEDSPHYPTLPKLIEPQMFNLWMNKNSVQPDFYFTDKNPIVIKLNEKGHFQFLSNESLDADKWYEWTDISELQGADDLLDLDPKACTFQEVSTNKNKNLVLILPSLIYQNKQLTFQLNRTENPEIQNPRWQLQSNKSLHIAQDQTLEGFMDLKDYLILENDQNEKSLLLSKNATVVDSKFPKLLSLLPVDGCKPKSRIVFDNLLIAYNKLLHSNDLQDYKDIIILLKKAKKFEVYTAEELELLGKIILLGEEITIQSKKTPPVKGSILANAVRLYVLWMVEDNFSRNPTSSKKLKRVQTFKYLQDDFSWTAFWKGDSILIPKDSTNPNPSKSPPPSLLSNIKQTLVRDYFAQRERLPIELRITTLLSQQQLADFEMEKFIVKPNVFPQHYPSFSQIQDFFDLFEFAQSEEEKKYFFLATSQRIQDRKKARKYAKKIAHTPNNRCFSNSTFSLILEAFCDAEDSLVDKTSSSAKAFVEAFHHAYSLSELHRTSNVSNLSEAQDDALNKINDSLYAYMKRKIPPSTKPLIQDFKTAPSLTVPSLKLQNLPQAPLCHRMVYPFALSCPINLKNELTKHFIKETQQQFYRPFEPMEEYSSAELLRELNEDLEIGHKQICDSAYYKSITTPAEILKSKEIIQKTIANSKHSIDTLERVILDFPDSQRTDPYEIFKFKSEIMSGTRAKLTIIDFEDMFMHEDPEVYKRLTGITDPDQIKRLHEKIGFYLDQSMQNQNRERYLVLLNKLEKAVADKSSDSQIKYLLQRLAIEADQVMSIDPQQDVNLLMIFQKRMNVILKKDQVEAFRDLYKKNPTDGIHYLNTLVQRIQGAGKTFFIAPTIATAKADGYHVSFLVSSTAQYKTNLQNFEDTSTTAYSKGHNTITFDASPKQLNPQYLSWMYRFLLSNIENRTFINVTKETLQTLLCTETKIRLEKTHPKALLILTEIRQLIQSRGTFTFDEAHKAYSPLMIFNIPTGEPYNPNKEEVAFMKDLFIEVLSVGNATGEPLDLLHPSKIDPQKLRDISEKAFENLISNSEWQNKFGLLDHDGDILMDQLQELREYVLGITSEMPAYLVTIKKNSNGKCAADIAILARLSIAEGWLKDRIQTKVFAKHALKEEPNKPRISRPCKATGKWDKGVEFTNEYVMIYNTLIGYAVSDFTHEQIINFITYIRQLNEEETKNHALNNPYDASQGTLAFESEISKKVTTHLNFNIHTVKTRKTEDIVKIQKALSNRENIEVLKLALDFAADQEICKVSLYPEEISVTGQDTALYSNSNSAFSGSVNKHMMPPKTIPSLDKGTTGQTLTLLRNKNTETWGIHPKYESIFDDLINVQDAAKKERIRCMIDIGSHFAGMSNEEIAKMICQRLQNPNIKKVLYFDTVTNELWAMDKNDQSKKRRLTGTSEDVIKNETGLEPQERFTFYDNYNCEGADIVQAFDTIGVVTVNEKTNLTEKVQGVKRLFRGFEWEQEVICAVHQDALNLIEKKLDKSSSSSLSKIGKINATIDFLCIHEHLQEKESVSNEAVALVLQKIHALFKFFYLIRMDKLPKDLKESVSESSENIFKSKVRADLYDLHVQEPIEMSFTDFWKKFSKMQLDPIRKLVSQYYFNEILDRSQTYIKEFIIEPSKEDLPKTVMFKELPFGYSVYQTLGIDINSTQIQLQQQNQQQLNQNLQQQISNQTRNSGTDDIGKGPIKPLPFSMDDLLCFSPTTFDGKNLPLSISCIDESSNGDPSISTKPELWELAEVLFKEDIFFPRDIQINDNILVESNFAAVVVGKTSVITGSRKSIDTIALVQESGPNNQLTWKAVILDLKTAANLQHHLATNQPLPEGKKIWLVRPTGAFYPYTSTQCPQDPQIFEDPIVRRLMTQILFFDGNFRRIGMKKWLDELDAMMPQGLKREAYQSYFEENLMYGNITGYEKSALKTIFSKRSTKRQKLN